MRVAAFFNLLLCALLLYVMQPIKVLHAAIRVPDYEHSMAQIVINIDVATVQNFRSSTGNHFQNNPLITLNYSYPKRM